MRYCGHGVLSSISDIAMTDHRFIGEYGEQCGVEIRISSWFRRKCYQKFLLSFWTVLVFDFGKTI
jgi:hypothetical protein